MKAVAWASAFVVGILAGTVTGRPLIGKRALVTEVVYVTETVANVAVYVDENGAPYSTSIEALVTSGSSVAVSTTSAVTQVTSEPVSAPAPMSTSQASSSSVVPAPPVTSSFVSPAPVFTASSVEPSSAQAKENTPTSATPEASKSTSVEAQPTTTPPAAPSKSPELAPPPSASSSAVPVDTNGDDGRLGMGVTYDPFTPNGCKSDATITDEFAKMKDFKVVRIYGMGCNIIPLAVENVVKNGQKLMAGIYLTHRGGAEDPQTVIQTLKSAIDQYANGDWSIVALFSVENERVNDQDMTVSEVVDAINQIRGQLRGVGYQGPVGAVETVPATMQNPAICQNSDVVMVNCHAFFDSNTKAEDAGKFVKSQIDMLNQACPNKRIVVTESGWPHSGDRNGQAIPSPENQKAAVASIREMFDHDMFIFNAFDSPWKSDSGSTFNAERFWGIMQ